jgi:hypothetical protein
MNFEHNFGIFAFLNNCNLRSKKNHRRKKGGMYRMTSKKTGSEESLANG